MTSEEEKHVLQKIEKGIVRAIDEYSNNPSVTMAVSSIPTIGPVIDMIIQTTSSQISQRRFLELCRMLKEEIALIDETKIDKSFLESEEGCDLIRKAFRTALETAEDEKIRLYARILVRAAILDNASYRYHSKDFLSILLELSPADLTVAREIYNQQKHHADKIRHTENQLSAVETSGWKLLPTICKMDETEFDLAVAKLARVNLIKEIVGSYYGYEGGEYRITNTFRRMMKLIEKLD